MSERELLRRLPKLLRANLQRRGAVPRDVPWERTSKATKRLYRKEARAIVDVLSPRQQHVPPTSNEAGK